MAGETQDGEKREKKRVLGPLTAVQAKLVRDNVGLVMVHLRRFVRDLTVPRRDREWEDLFQEGCLGLIQAALRHRPERGIPFASFALPRIHNAVSKALQSRFATVYVPWKRHDGSGDARSPAERIEDRPTVSSLTNEAAGRLTARPRQHPDPPSGQTIGQRLREKYERAVEIAKEAMSQSASTRGDRDALVRVLVDERFLVPQQESKRALRQIARETKSSYARVAQCEKQIGVAIRRTLESDPEFLELRRRAHGDLHGPEQPIDDEFERDLARVAAEELTRRFRRAAADDRSRLLHGVMEASHLDVEAALREQFQSLPPHTRERLLRENADPSPGKTRLPSSLRSRPRTSPHRRRGRGQTRDAREPSAGPRGDPLAMG